MNQALNPLISLLPVEISQEELERFSFRGKNFFISTLTDEVYQQVSVRDHNLHRVYGVARAQVLREFYNMNHTILAGAKR